MKSKGRIHRYQRFEDGETKELEIETWKSRRTIVAISVVVVVLLIAGLAVGLAVGLTQANQNGSRPKTPEDEVKEDGFTSETSEAFFNSVIKKDPVTGATSLLYNRNLTLVSVDNKSVKLPYSEFFRLLNIDSFEITQLRLYLTILSPQLLVDQLLANVSTI